MKKKLILQEDEYSIWRHEGIPDEALEFLDRIAWGNDGKYNCPKHPNILLFPSVTMVSVLIWRWPIQRYFKCTSDSMIRIPVRGLVFSW